MSSHDLSLTGQSISPIQGRNHSTRSSFSSSRELRNDVKTSTRIVSRSPRNANLSGTRNRRTRPAMALEFPNARSTFTRGDQSPASRNNSSSDYLSLFDSKKSYSKSSKHSASNMRKSANKPHSLYEERAYFPIPDSTRSSSTYYETARTMESADLPHATNCENVLHTYDKDIYEETTGVKCNEIKIPTETKDVLQEREDAAKKIQTWYKRHSLRARSSEAALKRMLHQKKLEREGKKEDHLQLKQRTFDQKRKQRQEREREARKQAIEELRKSREIQYQKNQALVQEELSCIASRRQKEKRKSPTEHTPEVTESQVLQNVEDKIEKIFEQTKIDTETPHETVLMVDKENVPPNPNYEKYSPSDKGETSKSQGLLESLLETIEKLESEPEQLVIEEKGSKLNEKLAWIDEMQSDYHSNVSTKLDAHSTASGAGDFVDGVQTNNEPLLTKAKLNNLMDFLDDVENRDEQHEARGSQCMESVITQHQDLTGPTKILHLQETERAATEVTAEMLKLRLDIDEKTKRVELLKKALSQQRELTIRHVQDQEKEMNQQLKMQKGQYESTIQRHLSFIDQLIDDKKTIGEKCEKLVLEMKQAESKYQKKIKQMQDAHSIELNKLKEVLSATEKLRREKWIEEKTRTIKEMTVKGLEPEIQRLITKHKQEVKKLKAIHEAELLQSDERAGQRYIRQTEELREQLEREKDNACTREREMARQRYEKQLEQEEMALQQQRRRLYAEVADEKERLNQQAARQRADIDRLKDQLEKHSSLASSALTEEYQKSKEEAERRHSVEMETLKERLELEKQSWQENYIKKQEAFILQKERELKEAVRRDRDAEIENVIHQLEKDMQIQRNQVEMTSENRIKRIREKYEMELKEIESLERQTQEKYNAMKVQYSDMDGTNMRLRSEIAQKEQEIVDIKKFKNKLVEERGNVTEVIREEFAERLVHTDEENKRLKGEVAQMRAKHRIELDRTNQEKEEELSEVHKRVKAALVKKEETVNQIKLQHDAAVKRADHLESLLEAQRKQLLNRKK